MGYKGNRLFNAEKESHEILKNIGTYFFVLYSNIRNKCFS